MSTDAIKLDGCHILTPDAYKAMRKTEKDLAAAEKRVKDLQREAWGVCNGACDLDCDGHGGRATPCRKCPSHPLRKGDPSEAIRNYLGDTEETT